MLKSLLVGAGDIGKRHLESLININQDKRIYVLDPSKEIRYEISNKYKLDYIFIKESSKDLPENIDICIISTTAKNRLIARN